MLTPRRRLDDPRSWQLPQGGIDEGEQPVNAALRELWEETNIRSVEVVTCVSVQLPSVSSSAPCLTLVLLLLLQMPKWVHYVGTTITKTSTPGVLYRYPGQRQKW
jgi:8-oxo-dGTP pyrophosphatase MutT (NUDIX family)